MAWQDEEKTRLTSIANAIKAKLGISTNIKASEFAEKIASISTGTDTSDATVTADDLAEGVTAYGADGEVTGSVTTYAANESFHFGSPTQMIVQGPELRCECVINLARLLRYRSKVVVTPFLSSFGNALASDVASGKTFTSSAGFVVTGTKTSTPSGTTITLPTPTLSVPSGSSNLVLKSTLNVPVDAQSGAIMQTTIPLNSFGNALASDVASGKMFTSSSGKTVSGTVSVTTSSSIQTGKTPYKSGNNLMLDSSGFSSPQMFKSGAVLSLGTALSNLGNATADDVAIGKTFTSSAGVKITGTAPRISVQSSNYSMGDVSGGGIASRNSAVTVSATPKNGYKFDNWTENGNSVSANQNYNFTATSNRNLVANFSTSRYVSGRDWHIGNVRYDANYEYLATSADEVRMTATNPGECFYSSTGNTNDWDNERFGAPTRMAYGNGIWVAVQDGATDYVCVKAPDDTQVNEAAIAEETGSWNWRDVAYGAGKFVAISRENNDTTGAGSHIAAWSQNGYLWNTINMATSENWWRIVYGGGPSGNMFLALSAWQSNIRYSTSTSGTSWEATKSLSGIARIGGVLAWNGVFYVSGLTSNDTPIVKYSSDGVNWSSAYPPVEGPIAYGDGKFVILGDSNTVAYSNNISSGWETSTLPYEAYWSDLVYFKGKFIGVGRPKNNYDSYTTYIYSYTGD